MAAITSELLLSQVRNTAPYVFGDDPALVAITASPPAAIVRACDPAQPLSHAEYFRLCVSAHYLTCATPVPTDVDNQIRKKLWASIPLATAIEMASFVLESHDWDFGPLGARSSHGAGAHADVPLNGHLGEWFTVSAAAYAALGAYGDVSAKALRAGLLDAIDREVTRHSEVFGSVWRAKDGLGALRAAVSIAHNFGDLDRVIEMWDVPIADPLRLRYGSLTASAFGHERELRYLGRLWTAGQLYKARIDGSSMAAENHRHFALRKPRALRSHPALRIPVGPFLDAWGAEAARRLAGDARDEVVDALVHGQTRMHQTIGYARGLNGMLSVAPELHARLAPLFSERPGVRKILGTPRDVLEARWAAAALAHLDEIPSRA